jgi:hypothetical protein
MQDQHRFNTKAWLLWTAGFLAFPIAGVLATAVAMGIGLMIGAWVVGYGTSLGELALMGFITGIPLGAAQAYLLRNRLANAWVWGAAMPLLWALGWTVTTAGGIDVDRQFAVFGAYGAVTFMACRGSCWTGCAPPPRSLRPHRPTRQSRSSRSHPAHLAVWAPAGTDVAAMPASLSADASQETIH